MTEDHNPGTRNNTTANDRRVHCARARPYVGDEVLKASFTACIADVAVGNVHDLPQRHAYKPGIAQAKKK